MFLVGDVFERLEQLPGRSVDLAIYSPPFLQFRSYFDAGDPLKPLEHGSEQSPAVFIDNALAVVAALGRVLTDRGSLCVELGDTSSGSGRAGGDYLQGGMRARQPGFSGASAASRSGGTRHKGRMRNSGTESPSQVGARMTASLGRSGVVPTNAGCGGHGWPLAKSLCMIPEAFRLALAYGHNPLNGNPSPAGRWIIRNVVSWVRTNPPPGELGDKFRRGTSTMVVATRAVDRWFDDFEVRRPAVGHARTAKGVTKRKSTGKAVGEGRGGGWSTLETQHKSVTAPPLDWWQIASNTYQSARGEHYAAFPEKLVETPILTMCPPRVCVVCGHAPTRRLQPSETYALELGESVYPRAGASARQLKGKRGAHKKDIVADYNHDGWNECDCDWPNKWRPGVVLDPYAGTGTTLAVAARHDRDSIGIDLDIKNLGITAERLGGTYTPSTGYMEIN